MSYQNQSAEPKSVFLNNLINLDFQMANSLFRAKNYADAINTMAEILSIIGARKQPELKEMYTEFVNYLVTGSAKIETLYEQFYNLQEYLMERWFSELHLGVIPTSTLPGTQERPDAAPANPNQTSRI
jgi:hypothetical protein